MESKDVFIDSLARIQQVVSRALTDISPNDLSYRPHVEANSIAWLAWHLTRWQDVRLSEMAGREQAWLDGWHAKFEMPANASDTGVGHTPEQVAGLRASAQALLDYHNVVYQRSIEYLKSASNADLDRVIDKEHNITVGQRLIGVLADNWQHAGQIAYLRGVLAEKHWMPH